MTLWIIIVAIGLATYTIRLSFIALQEHIAMPPLARRALSFVPIAVFSAIVLPGLFLPQGTLAVSPGNARLVAGLIAVAVAWRTQSIFLTIGAGMVALWVLQAIAR